MPLILRNGNCDSCSLVGLLIPIESPLVQGILREAESTNEGSDSGRWQGYPVATLYAGVAETDDAHR